VLLTTENMKSNKNNENGKLLSLRDILLSLWEVLYIGLPGIFDR
jgi:hypothetical protein